MLEDDILCDVITVIGKACEAPSNEQLNTVLAALKNTTFLRKGIEQYLKGLHLGNEASKKLDVGPLRDLIKLFSTYLHRLPSSFADVPIEEMENALGSAVLVSDVKGDVLDQLAKLKEERNQAIKEHREKTKSSRRRHVSQGPPPEDFREIPICPSVKEVTTDQQPYLRKHIKQGRFDDPEHYLDVQFRLLREDFVHPLRKGIAEVVNNTPRHLREERIKMYNGVKILRKDYTRNGIVFKVRFDVSPFWRTSWKSSKRLIFGSFLCISNDDFKTMLFATVANRDPDELRKGQFDIHFLEGQDVYGIEERNEAYAMAESPAYFESYRHVLSGLQELEEDSLPFQKYLVRCNADVDPPEYLRREEDERPVHYDLGQILNWSSTGTVPVLQPDAQWPCTNDVCLNESQLEAFKSALTREFCVIQGPPGTGKTYVGAKIVQCLLQNRRIWDPRRISPMLMVCYTNHALDQFLEKVLEFLDRGIIRVGSRSKNVKLEDFNLKHLARNYRSDEHRFAEWNREASFEDIGRKEAVLGSLDRFIPCFEKLEGIMSELHASQFHKGINETIDAEDAFKLWICNKDLRHVNPQKSPGGKDRILGSGTPENDDGDTGDEYMSAEDDEEQDEDKEDEFHDAMEYPWLNELVPGGNTISIDGIFPSESPAQGMSTGDDSFVLQTSQSETLLASDGPRDAGSHRHVAAFSPGETTLGLPPDELPSQSQGSSSCVDRLPSTTAKIACLPNPPVEEHLEGDKWETPERNEGHELLTSSEIKGGGVESCTVAENPERCLLESHFNGGQKMSSGTVLVECGPPESTDDIGRNLFETSYTAAHELGMETIEIENEADLLQDERFLAGEEEDFLPLLAVRSWNEADGEPITIDDDDDDTGEVEECNDVEGQGKQGFEALQPSNTVQLNTLSEDVVTEVRELDGVEINVSDSLPMEEGEDDYGWQVVARKSRKRVTDSPAVYPEKKNQGTVISTKDINKANARLKDRREAMSEDEVRAVDDVWMLPPKERKALYWYWINCYREKCIMDILEEERAYERHCKTLKETRFEEEERALRRATVIGMTTTGAARYHEVLHRIQPKIVVIEEAAEVLEAHIITALTPGTQHVIMIGDHEQLRPKATVLKLAQKYNLQISLFERMVLNEMDCKRLSTQHRMRPEIAQLTKRIYNHEITDHASVCRFRDVRGLQENLFFVDHQFPETFVPGLQSYSNKHEAHFIVALCLYLLLQGYKTSEITVLTMYTGQLLEFKQLMPRSIFDGVRVSVVDNFQGEENDIILLSLVRSNKDSVIGFLKESNRICVALSRARQGFYCIGNFTMLSSAACPLWKEICEEMKAKGKMGAGLQLACKTHDKFLEAKVSEDFAKFPGGGCGIVCEDRLNCGHLCGRKCDPVDPSHKRYKCAKPCPERCERGHPCTERCHPRRECGKCRRQVTKILPSCKHEQRTECGTDASTIICKLQCERILPCKHDCESICGKPCQPKSCKKEVTKSLRCGHEALLPCSKDPESAKCQRVVQTPLPCGHVKSVKCHNSSNPGNCVEKCSKVLSCGHDCQGDCREECTARKCMVLVPKTLHCGHVQVSHCGSNETPCQSSCEKSCSRGHPCQQRCHAGSDCNHCTEVITFKMRGCEHQREVPCYIDTATLSCEEQCSRVRHCGHKCHSQCGEPCDASPCTVKVTKALPCDHELDLPCHVDPEKYTCNVTVLRDLQCGHQVEAKCHLEPQEIICKTIVEIELECGHLKEMDCTLASQRLGDMTCKVMVPKPLPCGHQQTMHCSGDVCREKCKHDCPMILECGHPCKGKCGEDCKSVPCKQKMKKTLSCGDHYAFLKCSENAQALSCRRKCQRHLKCGHICPGKCFETCARQQCQEKVIRRLRCPSQHQYTLPCHVDVSVLPCKALIKVTFPCGHSRKLPCDETAKAICTVRCKKIRPTCSHHCRGICGEPCFKRPCQQPFNKRLDCGHVFTVQCCDSSKFMKCSAPCGVQLDCGHLCTETCSNCRMNGYHELCLQPCSRNRFCSHRCQAPCGMPCPPCTGTYERRCEHTKQSVSCSVGCTPCPMPCEKKCFHTECNNLCSESCDRRPCNEPCQSPLRCRHPCIGLCGDNCPTLCRKCHAGKLSILCPEISRDEQARFVQLIDCGHIINVRTMDLWMSRPLHNVQLRKCPRCSTPIINSLRYGEAIKQSFKDVLRVTNEAAQDATIVGENIKALVAEIENFGTMPVLQFPRYVLNFIKSGSVGSSIWQPAHLPHWYSCKNHLEIIRDISTTLYELTSTAATDLSAGGNLSRSEKSRMESILDGSVRALKDIEQGMAEPEFNLRRLSTLHKHVRKFRVAVQFIDARCTLAGSGKRLDRPGEAKVRDQMQRVASLVRGRPEFVDLQKLLDVVNDLRTRSQQPPLSMPPPVRLVNFPGFSRDSWFKCEKGHVYAAQSIVCDVTETEVRECRCCASQT